ncbi:MAG TPA: cupin domain-containing protein [Nitrospinota bacterium]|nr:cupin domain-containing protein [Nitrospinota bacterium]
MKKLNPSLYKNKVENPNETVYEVITAQDGLGWGLAIVDIKESELHVHQQIKEAYIVLEGKLELDLDGNLHQLKKGESIEILPKVKHKAKSLGQDPARIVALSFPAWTFEDHHLIKANE